MVSSSPQKASCELRGLQLSGTESDNSDATVQPTHQSKFGAHRRCLGLAVAGLAVTALFAGGLYGSGWNITAPFARKHVVSLQAEPAAAAAIPCNDYPYVKILSPPFWRNLGQAGPDYGDEGMFFNVTLSNVGTSVKEAQLRINADKGYVPSWNEFNGANGEWARINFNSGTAAGFTAYFWNKDTNTKMTLPRGYMSFSDLDGGPSAKEFIAVDMAPFSGNFFTGNISSLAEENANAPTAFIQTQVDPTIYGKTLMYSGSGVDLGKDNPDSDDVLTVKQKNNAVTLQIGENGLSEVKFKLGATPGKTSRTIQFNFQPTVFCASTLMPDGNLLAPLDPTFPPKTNQGEALDASKFPKYKICSGAACNPSVSTTSNAGVVGGTTLFNPK